MNKSLPKKRDEGAGSVSEGVSSLLSSMVSNVFAFTVPLLYRTRLAKPVKRDRERNFLPQAKDVHSPLGDSAYGVREDQVILGTLQSSDLIILNNGFAWKSRESTNEDQNVLFGKLARILLFEFKGKGREKPFALVDSHFKGFLHELTRFFQ